MVPYDLVVKILCNKRIILRFYNKRLLMRSYKAKKRYVYYCSTDVQKAEKIIIEIIQKNIRLQKTEPESESALFFLVPPQIRISSTTELSYLRSSSDHVRWSFNNTAYAVSGLIMKIIKDLIIHKKKRRLRL